MAEIMEGKDVIVKRIKKEGGVIEIQGGPISEASEEELLTSALLNNEAALSVLYDRYKNKIFTYIYKRTENILLAEDLAQEVWTKALDAVRNEKAWETSFSGWIHRIAHNLIIDYYRRRDRQDIIPVDFQNTPLATETEDPVEIFFMNIDADILRAAIRRLTDEQAEVISLRFLEGYSIAEVAALTNRTEGMVKALQHRATATLRILLGNQMLNTEHRAGETIKTRKKTGLEASSENTINSAILKEYKNIEGMMTDRERHVILTQLTEIVYSVISRKRRDANYVDANGNIEIIAAHLMSINILGIKDIYRFLENKFILNHSVISATPILKN